MTLPKVCPESAVGVDGLFRVKPVDSCRQAHAFQQTVPQLRPELPLMPPSPVLDQIESALLVLLLAQHFTPLEPLQALRVDLGAVPNPAPEEPGLIVALAHFGTDMRNEIAGIDACIRPGRVRRCTAPRRCSRSRGSPAISRHAD